jgi:hypothetical protein
MLMKFVFKMVLNGFILAVLLFWYADVSFASAVLASLIFMAAAWLIGDRLILRASNNTVATIADAVMVYLYQWFLAAYWNWDLDMGEMFITALFVAAAEWVFHRTVLSVDRVTL